MNEHYELIESRLETIVADLAGVEALDDPTFGEIINAVWNPQGRISSRALLVERFGLSAVARQTRRLVGVLGVVRDIVDNEGKCYNHSQLELNVVFELGNCCGIMDHNLLETCEHIVKALSGGNNES